MNGGLRKGGWKSKKSLEIQESPERTPLAGLGPTAGPRGATV